MQIQHQALSGFALVLYELATNAVKYGSLSLPKGSVAINLVMTDKFKLEWKERRGPSLTEAAKHEDFGTNLVRRVIHDQFAGKVLYDWNPEGLTIRLIVPSERLIDSASVRSSAHSGASAWGR